MLPLASASTVFALVYALFSSFSAGWPVYRSFLFLTGYEQWSVTQSSVPSMGFNGIAATFLGGLDPIGTIFASYFIQHITSGGSYLDKNIYPSQISDFISAIIIYLCGFVLIFKLYLNNYLRVKEEKAKEKTPAQANKEEGGNK